MIGSQRPITTDAEASDLLSTLVAIPSVAPGVAGGTGEAAMADTVEAFARATGAHVTRQKVLPGRENVICSVGAELSAPCLLLEAHMDTVALGSMTDGHEPRVDAEAQLHGRGACDTKGSLAAMLLALRWAACHDHPPGPMTLVAAVDEETGGTGAQALARSGIRAAGAIVGEPTSLDVVRVHRGDGHWRIATFGTAAHSSTPELGDNAIFRMVDVLQVIREEYDGRLTERVHPLAGASSFSVNTIDAGTSINVVPDRCELIMERRRIPGESPADVLGELEEVLEIARRRHPGLRVEIVDSVASGEVLDTPEDSPIVEVTRGAVTDVCGAARVIGVSYGSDAATLATAGIPSVLCGPGDIAYAHTADEFVPLTEVVQAAEIYARAWMGFADVVAASSI